MSNRIHVHDEIARGAETNVQDIVLAFKNVRRQSEELCKPLALEDYGIQTVPIVSPPKWHLAHMSWFYETFLLKPYLEGYQEYHPLYEQIFNSYYNSVGQYHPRAERGLLSRPTVAEVYQYRAYVDEHMENLLSEIHLDQKTLDDVIYRTVLGINHEQQHQELLLTDVKHIFAYNPLKPVYRSQANTLPVVSTASKLHWIEYSGGVKNVGFSGNQFAFDNESPEHKVYIEDFAIASRPVSNGEYLAFMEDGGYKDHQYWYSDAWKVVSTESWCAPLYWQKIDGKWWYMTLAGMQPVDDNAPVCHVSFYEAAAYAKWAGSRLPSESEWECVASKTILDGNFIENEVLQPVGLTNSQLSKSDSKVMQLFGDVWEWTQSAYSAYPGYFPARGALGEYNGKFMNNQIVLRGGSCVTAKNHIRATYRNFFYPEERWQFCGIRLAKDL